MAPIGDTNIPHEAGVAAATDAQMRRTSDHAAIADATPSVAVPTKVEFDAVVTKLNAVLAVLRDAELIPAA